MSKELEALEIIKSYEKKYSNKNICYYFTKEQYNIIKQALEQKEQKEKELEELKENILKEIQKWKEVCLDDPLGNAFVCTHKIKKLINDGVLEEKDE